MGYLYPYIKYFDNASTTYVYPEVIDLIAYTMKAIYGNPSNLHSKGTDAKGLIEDARKVVAGCLDADPKEIIFTSCASESNALAINQGQDVVASVYCHHDILDNDKVREGDILNGGDMFAQTWVQNETGEIFDVKSICENYNGLVLIDGTQALGNIDVKPHDVGCDFMSFSLHKCHSPKGIGILYNKDGKKLKPIIYGSQESGNRGGTENVSYIVGSVYAMVKALSEMRQKEEHCRKLREIILAELTNNNIDFIVNEGKNNISSILNIAFKGITGEVIMMMLDERGYQVSTGTACLSGGLEPSKTLTAMGVGEDYIQGAIRISMSLQNNEASARGLAKEIVGCING